MSFKLIYFPIRGRAEVSRLTLELAGENYTNEIVTHETWPQLKPTLTFQQVPVLFEGDSQLAQSNAIARHIARKNKLYGSDLTEQARIDEITEHVDDILDLIIKTVFAHKDDFTADHYKEIAPTINTKLNQLETLLKKSGTGYFVGNSPTLADVFAFNILDNWVGILDADTLNTHSSLKEFRDRFRALPKIAAYISSNRRPATTMPPMVKASLSNPEACK